MDEAQERIEWHRKQAHAHEEAAKKEERRKQQIAIKIMKLDTDWALKHDCNARDSAKIEYIKTWMRTLKKQKELEKIAEEHREELKRLLNYRPAWKKRKL